MNKLIKVFAVSVISGFFFSSFLSAQNAVKNEPVFKIDPVIDSVCMVSAAALEISSLIYPRPELECQSKDSVNSFDRKFMHSYDSNLDVAGWVMIYALAAGQLTLNFTAERENWAPVLVMSLETILISDGIKNYIKRTVGRERPYTYYDDSPSKTDPSESFVSGHSMNGLFCYGMMIYLVQRNIRNETARCVVTVSLSLLIKSG